MKSKNNVEKIKDQINNLGPFISGTISEQWNVCGKAQCACKDPKKPKKHGPYLKLGFSVQGKQSTMFIKKEDLSEVQKRIQRYQEFKQLCFDLLKANVELVKENGFTSEER